MATRKIALVAGQRMVAQSAATRRFLTSAPRSSLDGSGYVARQLRSSSTSSSVLSAGKGGYDSQYQELFDMMEAGRTSLGTEATDSYAPKNRKYLECGIPEDRLRFRTTAYGRYQLAPFINPAEHKVKMLVSVRDIPLESDLEREIFHQVVGQRFVQKTKELKLSSGVFASRIENKRHLVSMLERIVAHTKRLAKEVAEENSS
uniref:Small ribosomal subunit protein mS35 mitochondrial conserved domain-containing protein n=1 Tax=Odontella aurita TaxID=265563 RepID=A0A7S4N5K5_9STRA|mmetsp:Transcript_48037/g.145081  ORF Transcript_48037/g.145081 Transcript_48037/m.145081 type:complete len:203 (+) Transcript_48037:294-902(+)|eukprot:CAMPEP_0113549708 /NCGR_PEP_ID=MMETSP0015_2-20120614/13585_1 /TAXON_ID=2838 /ORGANISM="Odontella" /LENGTH=202 /DNA_ID=CAMNT_0000450451 /DNA_START=294 /DNA_END=902 /DNA_ORIENTATION=- /assembly_acc=CAM_ASM_000160